jgi:hypothetical protein
MAVGGYLLLKPEKVLVPDTVQKTQVTATTILQNEASR